MTPIMKNTRSYLLLLFFWLGFFTQNAYAVQWSDLQIASRASTRTEAELLEMQQQEQERRRVPKYHYGYYDREHTFKENIGHISALYAITWIVYPLGQWEEFRDNGSFKKFGKNFGELVFDKDEPFWNQIVHPITGSQLYLYYRANGYSRMDSFVMTTISSTLFELTVEIYTEPGSVQDLYITPVFGSLLGLGLEKTSMYLLNSGNAFGRFWGHVLNPATLFWFYQGKVRLTPSTDFNGSGSVTLSVEF